jgi:hypothetical protein
MTNTEALYDDLAGVVDLFGTLTRAELEHALDELAFKQGRDTDADALTDALEGAIESYYLVAYEDGEEELLAPGPVAFPSLPQNAEDLPHILDVPQRQVDRDALASATVERLHSDVERALDGDDDVSAHHLLDVTYDVEAWGGSDAEAADVRAKLDEILEE